jgi:cation/acetate symporter
MMETNIAQYIFVVFVLITLVLTWWAGKQTKTKTDFYTAGGAISPFKNGLAIAGDAVSVSAFLGMTSAIFYSGFDPLLIVICPFIWGAVMLFAVVDRLRNLGTCSFVDVISYRLNDGPVRLVFAVGGLITIIFYLAAQLVGAGKLIELIFNIDYLNAVILITCLTLVYVYIGGMLAATWIQMFKATVLIISGIVLTSVIIAHYNFNLIELFDAAVSQHQAGEKILKPGLLYKNAGTIITTVLTLICGFLGLPHVLIRLFTVKNAKDARKSIFYATFIMGGFHLLIIIMGFAAIGLLIGKPEYFTASGDIIAGGNMVVLHLSKHLLGEPMLGLMAAVSFATILAVVSGLIITGAVTISHDIYASRKAQDQPNNNSQSNKTEMIIFRVSAIGLCVLGIIMAILFEEQNVLFIAVTALSIAASVNFPILLMSIYSKTLTSAGAVVGGAVGLIVSLILIVLSKSVMVQILGADEAIFPYAYPTIISLPSALVAAFLVSYYDHSPRAVKEREAYEEQRLRSEGLKSNI